ncbi:putative ATPase, AAA-type, core, P-loop containing nucleoside triphosphate hydrolase [Helianthus anomalus]
MEIRQKRHKTLKWYQNSKVPTNWYRTNKFGTYFSIISVSVSGFLNFIDGLWSSCGDQRIIVFTTNHKEKLDHALLRPGRMDVHINTSYLWMIYPSLGDRTISSLFSKLCRFSCKKSPLCRNISKPFLTIALTSSSIVSVSNVARWSN